MSSLFPRVPCPTELNRVARWKRGLKRAVCVYVRMVTLFNTGTDAEDLSEHLGTAPD